MKSTAAECFSFTSYCEERSSELPILTFVEVPLKADSHEFVEDSLSHWVLSPVVIGSLSVDKGKKELLDSSRVEILMKST